MVVSSRPSVSEKHTPAQSRVRSNQASRRSMLASRRCSRQRPLVTFGPFWLPIGLPLAVLALRDIRRANGFLKGEVIAHRRDYVLWRYNNCRRGLRWHAYLMQLLPIRPEENTSLDIARVLRAKMRTGARSPHVCHVPSSPSQMVAIPPVSAIRQSPTIISIHC